MMSLTSRWMSQWMFIIGESVRCSYPKEFLTHVFNHRIVEKVVFTRCNSHGICHKDLKKPKAVDQSPQLLPRLLHTDDIEKKLLNTACSGIVSVSLATQHSWTYDIDIHFFHQGLCISHSLLQSHSCRNIILLTDFNNVKHNYIIVCFNILQFFLIFIHVIFSFFELGGRSPAPAPSPCNCQCFTTAPQCHVTVQWIWLNICWFMCVMFHKRNRNGRCRCKF